MQIKLLKQQEIQRKIPYRFDDCDKLFLRLQKLPITDMFQGDCLEVDVNPTSWQCYWLRRGIKVTIRQTAPNAWRIWRLQ